MARTDLDIHFKRVENLVAEISQFVPEGTKGATEFRADLAGLLVVSMAASYESCVKEILVNHASRQHVSFGQFANSNFNKLSSRVALADLNTYAELFDPEIKIQFKANFKLKKKSINKRTGIDIQKSYEQILSWRHDFAHAGIRNTTVEEATRIHRHAKRVLYCFDNAFNTA